jgi:hypothetical protein
MEFISQKGQDEWVIKEIFNYKKNGFFVDLAASDGKKINNTYLLEKELNWNGICIEPNPFFFEKLKINRKCYLSNEVIDSENGKEVEFRIDNKELGGIVDSDTDNNPDTRGEQLILATIIKRYTKTLDYTLDHFNAPKIIDYLSLDIEGAEERALVNFPFDKYTFLSLTIERPTENLEKILFSNGYIFLMKSKKMKFDSFYVHKSISNLKEMKIEEYFPTEKKKW